MSDGQMQSSEWAAWAAWPVAGLEAGVRPGRFQAVAPAHPSAEVGHPPFPDDLPRRTQLHPVYQLAERLWGRLEQESGREILTQCGGLSIGETDGSYIPALLDSIRRTRGLPRGPPVRRDGPPLRGTPPGAEQYGILDRRAGFLRTDRAVLRAVDAARENGAQLIRNAPVREIREVAGGVQISTDTDRWTFDRVIVAAGFGSGPVLPPFLQRQVHTKRNFLTWFTAGDAQQFVPEAFRFSLDHRGSLPVLARRRSTG